MPPRQQPPARQGVDRAGMSLVEQGDRRVHHRQPGADQQHGNAWIESAQGIGRPGVRPVKWRVVEGRIGDRHRLRREITDGEHREIRLDEAVAIKPQHHRAGGGVDGLDVAANQLETVARRAFDLIVQQPPDIGSEQTAGDEAVRGGRDPVQLGCRQPTQPRDEVVRPVVERAHPACRDVQQVAGVSRGIGLATAELVVLLDQDDPRRGRTAAQQMQRQQGPAESCSNDSDRSHVSSPRILERAMDTPAGDATIASLGR